MERIRGAVSVIIPTYKGSDKIERAVKSVLNQTYHPTEVIVVDDNGLGTEAQTETEKVIEQFKSLDNFKYIPHDKNKNGAAARNTGINASNGEYLCFLDDDDEYLPHKVESQVREFEKLDESYGMMVGSVKIIEGNYESVHRGEYKQDFLYEYLSHQIGACSSTVMVRSSVLDIVKGWDESFRRHQDWEFFARVAASFKVFCIDDIGVLKYKYDNNLPKDGRIAEEYRAHYLNKIKPLIEGYTPKQQKKIYFSNYIDVGKFYLKSRNVKDAIRLAFMTKSPVRALCAYIADGVRYFKKMKIVKG